MNMHKNASTTPYTRALMVKRVIEQGRSIGTVAEELGISVRTI